MSRRLKSYFLMTAIILTVALLLGPPLSIAKNLPTVCNIFDKKMTEKAGSCGHRAAFSKTQDKSFEVGAALFSNVDIETSHFRIIQSTPLSVSISFTNNNQSNPLRC
jgi:hypothetical protein